MEAMWPGCSSSHYGAGAWVCSPGPRAWLPEDLGKGWQPGKLQPSRKTLGLHQSPSIVGSLAKTTWWCFSRESWWNISSLCCLRYYGRVYPKNSTAKSCPDALCKVVQCTWFVHTWSLTEEATFCRRRKRKNSGFWRQDTAAKFWFCLWPSSVTLNKSLNTCGAQLYQLAYTMGIY